MPIDDILVSICCLTYNHEKYIKDCLNGFLCQKTNFKFEVLIHDDASTDSTPDIIRQYEALYPDIIKPIYQKVNQYSQGIAMSATYLYPIAKGKYIAKCEGDDFWIDPYKLQTQIDFLEKNEDFGFVYTNCYFYYQKKKKLVLKKHGGVDVAFEKLLLNYRIPTASIVVRKHLLESYLTELTEVSRSKKWLMGDYPMSLWFSLKSKIKAFENVSSVYRVLSVSTSHFKTIAEYSCFLDSIYSVQEYFIDTYCQDYEERIELKNMCLNVINYRYAIINVYFGEFSHALKYILTIPNQSPKSRILSFIISTKFLRNLYRFYLVKVGI